ncbi:MAG: DNA replication/repair protein RecF [Holosporaceae bacterium]|jgi:DNA replication and repair protein RecF
MLTTLKLLAFRNHAHTSLTGLGRMVALVGANGAGKTNLLEAVSLFAPGRGLRGAAAEDFGRAEEAGTGGGWGISALLHSGHDYTELHTGIRPADTLSTSTTAAAAVSEGGDSGKDSVKRRQILADGKAISQADLLDQLHIHWLTPAYDQLLVGAVGDRRRFLDRLVFGLFPQHLRGLNRYEHGLRERMTLLRHPSPNGRWLDAVEAKLAENALAIAAARLEVATRLNRLLTEQRDGFLQARLSLNGMVEQALATGQTALAVEEALRAAMSQARANDAAQGINSHGVHRSDLVVSDAAGNRPGARCSTGEQKALMLSLTLAYMRLVTTDSAKPALLLLDEVVAHLDARRRRALGEQLADLPCQLWLTATDASFFDGWPGDTNQFFAVDDGRVT